MVIEKKELQKVLNSYPHYEKEIKEIAHNREEKNNQAKIQAEKNHVKLSHKKYKLFAILFV
jgi:hypothetical protein